jgi:opacity protein-like surface antigen
MANALWDFDYKPFVFSAGFGLGASSIKIDEMGDSEFIAVAEREDTVFSGQLILGVSYQLNEKTSVGMNYRYLMVSDLDDNGFVAIKEGGSSDISFDSFDASIFELFVTWRF